MKTMIINLSDQHRHQHTSKIASENATQPSPEEFPDLPASALMSPAFFIFAIASCLVTSVFGSIVNFFLFYKFLKRDGKVNGFQKICLIKTLPNFLICFAFLFWVVPTTALSLTYTQLPYRINTIIGNIAGSWAYLFTPFMQVSLSCNRFYVLYFPFGIKFLKRVPVANISIGFSVAFVSCVCSIGLQKTCGYVYDPNFFTWRPELFDCATHLGEAIVFMIFVLTFTSNSFNVATGARLLVNKMVGMNAQEASRRRKRWMIMFTQSVIQDCLHLIDIINATYVWKWSDELWYQFLFLTLSFIIIYTLDGVVMFIFNSDIQPSWFRRIITVQPARSSNVIIVASKASTSNIN